MVGNVHFRLSGGKVKKPKDPHSCAGHPDPVSPQLQEGSLQGKVSPPQGPQLILLKAPKTAFHLSELVLGVLCSWSLGTGMQQNYS